jgi:type II pantothenate kinase
VMGLPLTRLLLPPHSYMNAEKYGLDRIYFGGCFIRGHAATISTLSYAIRFWSRGTVRAMFLRHEGFL